MDAASNPVAPAGGEGDLVDYEVECQRILMNVKSNYQTLKAEHARLQTEYARSQNELKQLRQEKQTVQDLLQILLAVSREEIAERSKVGGLKAQVITPQKLDLLRAQMQHDLEKLMRDRFRKLDEEVGGNRAEYNRLRYEHNFLRSEFEHQKEEHARVLEESRLKYESEVVTPRKLELLKAQTQHDIEVAMRECFRKLDEEVGKNRAEYNKLRYEHNFLRSEFEYQKEEHARILEESKFKYRSEVARLEKDNEDLHDQLLNADLSRDNKQVEALRGEKAQLVQKLKGLEAEVAELRAQRENPDIYMENVQRIQICHLAEMQAAMSSLQAEKQLVKLQLERTKKELLLSNEQKVGLTRKLHKVLLEVSALTTKVEEIKHSNKLKGTVIELEAAQARSEIERNKLQAEIDELFSDNEILKTKLEQMLVGQDPESTGQVQAAKEEDFQNLAGVLEKKNETKLVETENKEQDCERQLQEDQYEKEISALTLTEESTGSAVQKLKLMLQQQFINSEELEKESGGNANPKQNIQGFQLGEASFSLSENAWKESSQERIQNRCHNARRQVERGLSDARRSSVDQRAELDGYIQLIREFTEKNRAFTEKSICTEGEMKDSCSF